VTDAPHPDPAAEYRQRRTTYAADAARHEKRDALLANVRLLLALAVLAMIVAGFYRPAVWFAIAAPIAVFIAVAVWHDRVIRTASRSRVLADHYARALTRVEGNWTGTGPTGKTHAPAAHPYAADLDLFGHGSLFAYLCAARSQTGQATLARWLTSSATPDMIAQRHGAVAELRPRLDLRDDLVAACEAIQPDLDGDVLRRWASRTAAIDIARTRRAAIACNAGLIAGAAVLWLAGTPIVLALAVAAQAIVLVRTREAVETLMAEATEPARELRLLAAVFQRFEQEKFQHASLTEFQKQLTDGSRPASACIADLERRIGRYDAQRNLFVAPFALAMMWGPHTACHVEQWRRAWSASALDWLDALGALEALNSLAGFAYERPDSVNPIMVNAPRCFRAKAIRHPLLPATRAVPNDVSLDENMPVMIVSGSNMSGKSTLLRTVGINAALALAGAPVCASRLEIAVRSLGSTIAVHDSLQEGASRFYAEIERLKELMDLASADPPLLYLLDELLHGTNSKDRAIGARALLKAFMTRGAVGIVTTHDLSLSREADATAGIVNMHFADRVEEGRLTFDYTLKPGVVDHGNALALMRQVGLPVEED